MFGAREGRVVYRWEGGGGGAVAETLVGGFEVTREVGGIVGGYGGEEGGEEGEVVGSYSTVSTG